MLYLKQHSNGPFDDVLETGWNGPFDAVIEPIQNDPFIICTILHLSDGVLETI